MLGFRGGDLISGMRWFVREVHKLQLEWQWSGSQVCNFGWSSSNGAGFLHMAYTVHASATILSTDQELSELLPAGLCLQKLC